MTTTLKISLILALSLCAMNSSAQSLKSQLLECHGLKSDLKRLACYDNLADVSQGHHALNNTSVETAAIKTTITAPVAVEVEVVEALNNQTLDSDLVETKALKTTAVETSDVKAQTIVEIQSGKEESGKEEPVSSEKNEIPDGIGGSRFSSDDREVDKTYRAKIVSCSQAGDGKTLFVFASKQVWKQVQSSKRRYKNCNYDVTIGKDVFGYKMAIDGKRGSIRISRKR